MTISENHSLAAMPPPEFSSFENLTKAHREGHDFHRVIKPVDGAKVAIIAPHGGRIEPHTDVIATTLAGTEFSLYCFNARLPRHEANLHITSHNFDDSKCLELVEPCEIVVTVHGWGESDEALLIGGLDSELINAFAVKAREFGVVTHTNSAKLAGTHPQNICNRGKSRRGVQLEFTMALRESPRLQLLLAAFRDVLLQCQDVA